MQIYLALIQAQDLTRALKEWDQKGSFNRFLDSGAYPLRGFVSFELRSQEIVVEQLRINRREYPEFWDEARTQEWATVLLDHLQRLPYIPVLIRVGGNDELSVLRQYAAAGPCQNLM